MQDANAANAGDALDKLETTIYWAAIGTYQRRPGFYIVLVPLNIPESLRYPVALSKLNTAVLRTHQGTLKYYTLREAWEGLEPCIEDIAQRRTDYYDRLSPNVFFFEE